MPQSLHEWAKRDEVDTGVREGVTISEAQRVKELEREIKEPRRANEDPAFCHSRILIFSGLVKLLGMNRPGF